MQCVKLPRYVLITGFMGSGKSTVSELLRAKTFKVIDSDSFAKNLYKTDDTLKKLVISKFGIEASSNYEDPDKPFDLDFEFAKKEFFKAENDEKRRDLESYICGYLSVNVQFNRELWGYPVVFIEAALTEAIPTLVELLKIKTVIDVSIDDRLRASRLAQRGIDTKTLNERMRLQKYIDFDETITVYPITNNGTIIDLYHQVDDMLKNGFMNSREKYQHFKAYLDNAPEYCRTNTWCYLYYNNKGCSNCPFPCDNRNKDFDEMKEKYLNRKYNG